ncbi:DUF2239 family protein [Bdellovibrionota bacterium FG-1]
METPSTYTAFDGEKFIFRGSLNEVISKIKKRLGKAENSAVLIFSDLTGKTMDFNFQGTEKDVLKRLEVFTSRAEPKDSIGPGRPKLGVISREVSLLPRHWEWLASQPGGASASLRKLVEEAKKKAVSGNCVKQAQERTYRFMSVMAGDLEGYEDALRSLYRGDKERFLKQIEAWPRDVRVYAAELAT